MARRAAIHKNNQYRVSMMLAALVVLMLMVVVAIGSISMNNKLESYTQREANLIEQIAVEHERAQEIENQEKYTHTMKFIEEIARKRLGLVYEGEIIFRQGN
ncbi:MAG: septum formation initiator family protein [Lachnospiraceae bacterium]|nr:septum formation initiator family protein [Lachnospiraceae bacterium]